LIKSGNMNHALLLQVTTAGYVFIVVFIVLILSVRWWFRSKKRTEKSVSIFLYLFLGTGALMLTGMMGAMAYFVYQRLFTHEKDDAPMWSVLLCIFFLSVLLFVIIGNIFKDKKGRKDGKTDFDNLEEALLTPEAVSSLSLSGKGLSTFPSDIYKFINLINLDLSNNQLSTLPLQIADLKYLASVKLSNNPVDDQERARLRRNLPPELELIFKTRR